MECEDANRVGVRAPFFFGRSLHSVDKQKKFLLLSRLPPSGGRGPWWRASWWCVKTGDAFLVVVVVVPEAGGDWCARALAIDACWDIHFFEGL